MAVKVAFMQGSDGQIIKDFNQFLDCGSHWRGNAGAVINPYLMLT